ncbi:MAG TPA: chromate efflux transporter, partial [Flavobacterium sp.]|uniref:chromate efflux transporter n=1 Tax=Flavobacterium sp. TaxID=239 RepID=UPI002ED190C4
MIEKPTYTLRQLVYYFLKLGTTGFGGPVALVGYMHEDLVEKRKWVSEENYKEGLALAQLAPGPLAAQLGIYLGFLHYRLLGATLAGLAFIIPSFIIVLLLSITYTVYGGLSWLQAIFYGVGAAVIGIIVMSSYKLTQKSIGKFTLESLKNNWLLWLIFGVSLVITLVTKREHILLFIGAGLIYMFYKSPQKFWRTKKTYSLFILQILFFNDELTILQKIAIFFIKAGAFVFGSGLAIIPFLYAGVVTENHWLTEQQFLDAVAIAMITPGPVVITVAFIGYIVAGF